MSDLLNFTKQSFGFLVLGALVAFLVVYFTPLKNLNIIPPQTKEVSPEEFHALYLDNPEKYVFIDVRSVEDFNKVHVEGSKNIPLHLLYDEHYNLPKTGKEIVLICSGGRAAGVGYMYLEHYGFLNLKRVTGGIQAWQAAGLPVVTALD